MHSIKFFTAGILAAITVSSSPRADGMWGGSQLYSVLAVSAGIGIFALAGYGFGTAFADYDGTEHPWDHTHEVSFATPTDVMVERDSPYGIRHHEQFYITVNPPFHFNNGFVNVQIIDVSATYGEDYILFLPDKTGSNDTKVLRLPVGEGLVTFIASVRNDNVHESTEEFLLKLKPAEYGSYYTVGRYTELDVVILTSSDKPGAADYTAAGWDAANPNRGMHIQPDKITVPIGGNASYGISLNSAPSHPVVVEAFRDVNGKSLNLGDIRDGSYTGVRVSPSLLNFTADNWNTQQFFTVTAGDSDPGRYIIIHGLTSFDLDYDSGRHFTGPGIIGSTHVVINVAANSAPPRLEVGDSPRFPTSVTLSLGTASVSEGAGTATITATLDAPAPPGGVTMSPYSSGGNATDGTDYTLPGSIYISAGDRSGSASITITDDTAAESDERAVITVFAEILGQAMTDSITLTITDNDGVIVAEQTNRAPTISSAISDVTIPYEDGTRTISLAGVFSDADDDSLSITASSSDAAKAGVSVASDYTSLTLTAKARGTATVTVTASDGNGGTTSDAFRVEVKATPAVSSAISDVSGLDAGDSRTISLDGVFDDADGDSLAVTTTSSNGSVATVEAASDGSALTVTAQAPGTATIRVTAQDADGNRVTDSFVVTVDAQQPADVPEPDSIVARYDTDGSGVIEQDEWVVAKEDYAGGKLTNKEIHALSNARA